MRSTDAAKDHAWQRFLCAHICHESVPFNVQYISFVLLLSMLFKVRILFTRGWLNELYILFVLNQMQNNITASNIVEYASMYSILFSIFKACSFSDCSTLASNTSILILVSSSFIVSCSLNSLNSALNSAQFSTLFFLILHY